MFEPRAFASMRSPPVAGGYNCYRIGNYREKNRCKEVSIWEKAYQIEMLSGKIGKLQALS